MKLSVNCLIVLLVFASSLWAQQDPDDPGAQDSLIVGSVNINVGQTFCFLPVYAVTDDTVAFYNLPLTWNAPGGGVRVAEDNVYFPPLTSWSDIFDSVFVDQNFIRQIGWASLNPGTMLNTRGVRQHIWSMRIIINRGTPAQTVVFDTTWDSRDYSMMLGLKGGVVDFMPAFLRGYITISPLSGVNDETIPIEFRLDQNYPNPFNAQTTISYSLSQDCPVTLSIYNIMGQKVATLFDGVQQAGEHKMVWDAGDVTSGVYFYRIVTDYDNQTARMILLR
jgi:hypothetical protein